MILNNYSDKIGGQKKIASNFASGRTRVNVVIRIIALICAVQNDVYDGANIKTIFC